MVRAGGRTKPRIAYKADKDSEDGGDSSDDNRESPAPPPPKKRKPPMKPPAKKAPPPKDESSDDGMESEEDERPMAKKVSRAPPKKTVYKDESSGDEDGNESDYVVKKSPQKAPPKKASPTKKAEKPPSKVIYKDVESSDDFQDDGEVDNAGDSDFEEPKKKPAARAPAKKRGAKTKVVDNDSDDSDDDNPPPKKISPKKGAKKAPQKKTPAKKSPAKKAAPASSRASGRGAAKPIKYTYDSDDEEEENSVEEVSSDEAPAQTTPRGKKKMAKKPAGREKPPPPIGSFRKMIPAAIKKLRDNPRKGSSLAAIKGIMAEEWEVDIKAQAPKIKKFLLSAVESGELIQTKGKGASGRFTVPGLKIKKKKATQRQLNTKMWDEDQEPEYKPAKTARSEDKDKFLGEQMQRRKERMEAEARRLEEKEKMPKKIVVRKDVYEVESIKAMKTVGDKTWYNVMYEKAKKGHWEPEENLEGCREIIDNFLMEEKVRLVQEEERRRREEEEGKYEVKNILEVKFKKGEKKGEKKEEKKEFLIRWKGHGEEMDSWEPEENLDCLDLIDKFMKKWQSRVEVEEKELRIAPTKVKRLQFSVSKRVNKRNNGFRETYEDMDEDWD